MRVNCRTAINSARIAATYTGTVIGAGFSSGQELMQFFVSYGSIATLSLVIAGVLFSWFGASLLNVGHQLQSRQYTQGFYRICGPRLGWLLDFFTTVFLFSSLTIMLAGMGTVGRDYLGLPFNLGLGLMAIIVTLTVCSGIDGIANCNLVVIPILIVCTGLIGVSSLLYHGSSPALLTVAPQASLQPAPHWLLGCLLYVSFNVILAATVLVPLGAATPSRRERLLGGIFGGLTLSVLALFIAVIIILHFPAIASYEVPMLYVSSAQHPWSHAAYAATLVIAMYTTAIASFYGCMIKMRAGWGLRQSTAMVVIVGASIILGQVGFVTLIAALYPAFGYLALWFTVKLAWQSVRRKR